MTSSLYLSLCITFLLVVWIYLSSFLLLLMLKAWLLESRWRSESSSATTGYYLNSFIFTKAFPSLLTQSPVAAQSDFAAAIGALHRYQELIFNSKLSTFSLISNCQVILVRRMCHLCRALLLFLSLKLLFWATMMLGTPKNSQRVSYS